MTVNRLLDNLINDYILKKRKSLSQTIYHMKAVREKLGHLRAVNVTTPILREYIQRRQVEGAAPATTNRELAGLRRAFKLAVLDGTLNRAPSFVTLTEDNARQGFFERKDVNRLLTHLPPYLHDVVLFAFLTGWRKEEVLGLTWKSIDLDGGVIYLRTSKTERGRAFPLHGLLRDVIDRRYQARQVGDQTVPFVFHRNGNRIRGFKAAWTTARKKTGLSGRVFHDFRRTAVRNLIRAGVREKVAMELTGHKTRSIFDRYNIVDEVDLREAAQRLHDYLGGQKHGQFSNSHPKPDSSSLP